MIMIKNIIKLEYAFHKYLFKYVRTYLKEQIAKFQLYIAYLKRNMKEKNKNER